MSNFENIISAVKDGQIKDFEFGKFNVKVKCMVNFVKVEITDKKGETVVTNTTTDFDNFNMSWAERWAQDFLKVYHEMNAADAAYNDAKEIAEIAEDILKED